MSEILGELFDPKAEVAISEHCRPHWSQAGAIAFITFRTTDSIPREVLLARWEREKIEWLKQQNVEVDNEPSIAIRSLDLALQQKFRKHFDRCREDFLDECHGECVLSRPQLAKIVTDSLLHFDGERYRLGDFVIMPNHVHLLAVFPSEEILATQCDSWLHFTARQINFQLGRRGKFWQQEPFDHLVRSSDQYEFLRSYIKDNGPKAKLSASEYLYRRHDS